MNKIEVILEKTKAYKSELFEVEQKLLAPEIIADIVETRALTQKRKALYDIVCLRDNLERIVNTKEEYSKELSTADYDNKLLLTELLDELTEEETKIILKMLSTLIDTSGEETEELKVEIKAVGEDYGFCDKLLKMYAYFATINELFCQKVGNTLLIKGKNAKIYFDSATAIHKWYDTKTATAEVRVFQIFNHGKIEVNPDDVRIDIFLAHGKGGQNINKVETAVRLTHLPTNTVVTCQDERSQLKNKERAFSRLRDLLQQKQDELIKKQEEQQQENLTKELRKNQRKFFVSNGIFVDSRVDTEIDLNLALKGNINEVVQTILLENIG